MKGSVDVAAEDRPGHVAPAYLQRRGRGTALTEWLDRHARVLFITPAVVMIVVFSIFPTIASAILALSRVKLKAGAYSITFAGLANFQKQLFGSEQVHFLGNLAAIAPFGWAVVSVGGGLLVWWLVRYLRGPVRILGLVGRLITASMLLALILMIAATLFSGRNWAPSA